MKAKILIADDEENILDALSEFMEGGNPWRKPLLCLNRKDLGGIQEADLGVLDFGKFF